MPNRLDIVKATFEDFFERNSIDALMRSVADDVVFRTTIPASTPLGGEFRGKQGLLDYFSETEKLLELRSGKVKTYLVGEDTIVALGDEIQKVKSTGQESVCEWCTVFKFREDRISEILVIEDYSNLFVTLTNE